MIALELAGAAQAQDPTFFDRKTLFSWPGGNGTDGGPAPLDEPLASDRPDFTEASSTVGRGVWQIESGYTYIADDEAGTSSHAHSFPELLFRVGAFADWFEFRIGQNFANEATSEPFFEGVNNGATDMYLGAKLMLTPQDGWLPEMSLTPQMFVPTGSEELSNDEVLPGVNWLYGWDINEFLATGGSTQVNRAIDADSDADYTSFAQSWTVGYTLTEKLGAYTEWFGIFPHNADSVLPEHYFDGGFTYKATLNVQFDIRAGVGLNKSADDFFVGAGLVLRGPYGWR